MRYIVYPYKPGSKSAKALAEALGGKVIYYGHKFKPRPDDVVINWGNSEPAPWWEGQYINHPGRIPWATNKLDAFSLLDEGGVRTVEWTDNHEVALNWVQTGALVVCRTKLNSHSGKGIVLSGTPEELTPSPLYTKYQKKKSEYRVHVFKSSVIDIQQKRKKKDHNGEYNPKIRSRHYGWIFARNDVVELPDIRDIAIGAVKALGLDFGAVDILHGTDNRLLVLEVNTAPGLEGTTVQSYAQAIKNA